MVTEIKEIGDRGEIVIPKSIREEMGMMPKDKVKIVGTKNGMIIVPIKKSFRDFAGILDNKGIDDNKTLQELADEIMYS